MFFNRLAPGASRGEASPLCEQKTIDKNAEFEAVVARYHAKVFQLVYRYTGDYEEACDLTQDTFVRAFNAWDEFRGDSQVYTWLYRIALNLCHNAQKRIQRRQRMERWSLDATPDDDFDSRGPIEVADERPLPLQRLEGDEVRQRLREALMGLPENYRIVIVLRDIEGLTYEEIARVTDSTLEAIKSRLFRARQTLRRSLEPYMSGGFDPVEDNVVKVAPRSENGALEKAKAQRI